jgi:glycosyltransferase involved in cell wall biosynthesis
MPSVNVQEKISIIIPAYNEEKRIGKTLESYLKYYNDHYENNYELLVVLNGCRDNTEAVVKSFQHDNPALQYIVFAGAIGKGGAIKEGLKIAKGDLIGFTDADNSTRPEILHRLFAVIELVPDIDCAIGSRRLPGSVVKNKPKSREAISWGFNTGVNLLFNLGIKDTQCGAKVLRRELVQKVIPSLTISNMAFDVNILVDIKNVGGTVLEIPIEWEDADGSTIRKPFKTSVAMAFSVIRLRLMYSPLKNMQPIFDPIGRFLLRLLTGKN